MLKINIQKLLENEPLIINWQNIDSLKNNKSGSIFFGVGLMSKNQLSENLPFDILSFFFVSEMLKRSLNLSKITVLIADTHAASNQIFKNEEINLQANKTLLQLERIVRNFAFKDFEMIKASELHKSSDFQGELSKLPKMGNEYLRLEIADTLWLKKIDKLKIKLGWAISKENRVEGNDERFFDKEILRFCPKTALIHIRAGRTLNLNKPKASPYLSIKGEERILLIKNENVSQKLKLAIKSWQDKSLGGLISHLHDVVHCFEKLQGKLPFTSVEQKIQFILDKAVL